MNVIEMHDYLGRARKDLRLALAALPATVLGRPMLDGERFHCIKDLLFHIAAVADGWLHEDILRVPPVLERFPALHATTGGPEYGAFALTELLEYWQAVEQRMTEYLAALDAQESARIVTVHDAPDERYTVDGLLWHVMLHEVRHTAQICMLLRLQGIEPPSLDLLFYLAADPSPA